MDILNDMTQKRIDRFWSYVNKTETCWIWTKFKNKQGYGRFGVGSGKCTNAHRVAYFITYGSVSDDLCICHKCDNPSCVNPDHLFAGTKQDNANDMVLKKRSRHFKKNIYHGVRWEEREENGNERKGRWRSVITVDSKMIKIGCHTSVLEAARNYDRIAYMKYGIKDKLNFPEEYNLK